MQLQSLIIGLGLGFFQLGAYGSTSNGERTMGHGVDALSKRSDPTSPIHRIPNIPMESGIWMMPNAGVRCGKFDYSKREIYKTGDVACAEYKRMRKNFTLKFVSVGQVYRTNSRFNRLGQKFYIYPLTPLALDENGIYRPTPYVVITKNCVVIAVYLRTFFKPTARILYKSKFDQCWEGRNKPDGVSFEISSPISKGHSSHLSQNLQPSHNQ